MKKIIHMSDLHVGYRNFDERYRVLIDNLIFEKGDKASTYVIVITGDLVNNANKKESFKDVRKGIDGLRKAGFHDVLVVPGNHDYGTGNKGNKKFVKIFKDHFYDGDVEFPKKDIIQRVAFIGLDSMSAELSWKDELFAEGQIGQHQLEKLDEILREKDVRHCLKRVIYLHHHPFKWRPLHQLKDSKKLKKILMNAIADGITIDAVLFGHNHEGKPHHGKWGIHRCYDAGTATLKPRPKFVNWSPWFQIRSATRVIDLNQDPHFDYELHLL